MIKINLLPVKEKKRRQQVLIAVYIGLGLLLVAAVLGWLLSTRYRIQADLKTEIAKIEEESAGYQEKIQEIKALEASQARLESFRKVATSISVEQCKLIGSLDQLASILPSEIWLSDVIQGTAKTESSLTIRGYSLSQPMLDTFVRNLGRPGGFLAKGSLNVSNVLATHGGNRVYQFEVKADMVASK